MTASRVLPGSFGQMLHLVRISESTPPLYYILAWLWAKGFGVGAFALRTPSALFGSLTILVAYFIGKELAGQRAGLLAMAMAAFNPMLIWYSQEARAYALMVLLCTLSVWLFLRFRRSGSKADLRLWALSSALAIASHYFAVFPILVEAGWLLYENRRNRGVWLALAGIGGAMLALLPLAAHQANPGHIDWIGNVGIGYRLGDSGASFLIGETGRVIGADRPRDGYAIVPIVLIAALVAVGMRRGRRREWRGAAIGITLALGGVVLALVVAALGEDYVLARNLLPALVPLIASVAVIASFRQARRLGLLLVAALCAYWLAFDVYVSATPTLQRPDWQRVAEAVTPTPRARLLVAWTLGAAPLQYYLGDGTSQPSVGPFFASEIDVVSKSSSNPAQSPLRARFPRIELTRLGRFLFTRYVAPHRAVVGLRFLQDLNTGFPYTVVMVDGPEPAPLRIAQTLCPNATCPAAMLTEGLGPRRLDPRRVQPKSARTRAGPPRSRRDRP